MNLLRAVLLVLALALAGLLAKESGGNWRGTVASGSGPGDPYAQARSKVATILAGAPDFTPFFQRLQAQFPSDYSRIMDEFASRALTHGRTDSAEVYVSDALRMVRQARGIVAAKAAAPALGKVFDMQAAVMAAMAGSDSRLCVEFLYGVASPAFYQFAATHRPLIEGMAEAGIDAIADGQQSRIDRPTPTDASFDLLQKGLEARGLNSVEIAALLDGKAPDPPLPDARMCAAGRAYLDALHALPDEARLPIYALAVELMARS